MRFPDLVVGETYEWRQTNRATPARVKFLGESGTPDKPCEVEFLENGGTFGSCFYRYSQGEIVAVPSRQLTPAVKRDLTK